MPSVSPPTQLIPPTTVTPTVTPKKKHRLRNFGIGAGALLLLLIVYSAAQGTNKVTPTASVAPKASASVLVSATPNVARAQALTYANAVLAFTNAAGPDNTAMATACGAQDFTGCRAGAATLLVDLKAFKAKLATLAIPVAFVAVNTQLNAAVDTYIDGTQKEIQGIDSLDAALITEGAQLVQRGTTELNAVNPLLAAATAQLGG